MKLDLKKLREAAGLSQSELANRVGVTQGYISHIEKNLRAPALKILDALARELNVHPTELIVKETSNRAVGE
ncbi:helix-turn-helix domain-containing protein [Desulforamulus ruminis]|uniref:Helix-turn-helix domain protein n=1 Tax=Desulforamulus ruminis (strain ATCC 23193 / DSM 2154 / NCIMB 8452 / DL) TaxID=696281 RepID=F6DTY3_DESRL|nr:helix-turn-helix transcriptional regulator [Desulforamulus ruminis]AEG59001.1 helix-turn-helix domain protein [Desulforamulus ruminis DSM 2154]